MKQRVANLPKGICAIPTFSRGVGDGWPTAVRPLSVDAASGDLHLGAKSPCNDGTATVDMGVDEVLLRVYLPLILRGQ
jgi:hypothetical protein